MSDRVYRRLKEWIKHEVVPYRDMTEDIVAHIAEQGRQILGVPAQLPPPNEDCKPN